ncbi:winged helix-turn-helix transcriptional regulator [Peribacillus frigoritolerans]|uniref:winged helix-turn-helix transcriptional regulator n=1 Tax=Peribacillus frigoritolerans TaxID=450367 RepID=UPI00227D9D22|nr:helix-turn-helix domain-containing protein [Peribacillus frigoritolerans]MCY9002472.1 helix-turn-helix transcriptional regulator [Peribacillus frigoritolerans]
MEQSQFQEKVTYFKENMPKECPITYSMKIIGSKWKIPILWHLLLEDGQHYNELKRTVGGITNTMLTKSLRELEADGLVRRHNYETVPPSVTYHLTELGKNISDTLGELFEWGKKLQAHQSTDN